MRTAIAACLGLVVLLALGAAGAPGARASLLTDVIVTPSTSIVFSGEAPEELTLGIAVFPVASGYGSSLLSMSPSGANPRTDLTVDSLNATFAYRATFDPLDFVFGVSNIDFWLWLAQGVGTSFRALEQKFTARVLRQLALPLANILTVGKPSVGRTVVVPLRIAGGPGPASVNATVAWGDGTSSTEVLPVVDGVVILPPERHRYETQGLFNVTMTFSLDGETFGASTLVAVPAPPGLLLVATALAGLVAVRRFGPQRRRMAG